jgi:excisionase family DNA binding protein
MKPREVMTLQEVADELAISYEQARRLCSKGRLPAINVGTSDGRKHYRVRRDTFETFKRNEQQPSVKDEISGVRVSLAALNAGEQRW